MNPIRRALTASAGLLMARPLAAAIKSDETVLFFPAHAVRVGNQWAFDLRTRIFERERRVPLVAALTPVRQALGLDGLSDAEEALFRERVRLFLIDNERGKTINIQIGQRVMALTRSRDDGFSVTRVTLPAGDAAKYPAAGMPAGYVSLRAVLRQKDQRGFTGTVQLIEPQGVSIISDIDDTIKVTNVLDRHAMMRNTFTRPFTAVDGMAQRYAAWTKTTTGLTFHYVSASPWQLFEPLEAFRQAGGFPPGTFHLRELALVQLKAFAAPDAGRAHKLAEIERLLTTYPERRFWLVGDSGEQDPEVYGEMARRFPAQVARIFIREITNGPIDTARYQRAFDGLPSTVHSVFRLPTELPESIA